MEKKQENRYKQGENRAQITVHGGNIGGLVVWGGALAVASLIAAFAIKKSTKKDASKKDPVQKEIHGSLCSNLEAPSSTFQHHQCCGDDGSTTMVANQIESSEVVSTRSLILRNLVQEEDSNGGISESTSSHQELLADSSEQESATCEECDCVEESSSRVLHHSGDDLPVTPRIEISGEEEVIDVKTISERFSSKHSLAALDGTLYGAGNRVKNHSGSGLPVMERMENSREKETTSENQEHEKEKQQQQESDDGVLDGESVVERGVKKQQYIDNDGHVVEGEDEEGNDEEYVIEKGDESSGETVSTSTESNEEAIWPAEFVEVLSLEMTKGGTLVKDGVHESPEGDEIKVADNQETTYNPVSVKHQKEETKQPLVENHQTTHFTRRIIWVWSMFLVLLLMVSFLFSLNAKS